TAGSQSLTAGDSQDANLTGSQAGIIILPVAPGHLSVTSSVTVTVAGMPFDITVTVKDPYNNTVTEYAGTLTFASADPYGAALPAAYTSTAADSGTHTFAVGATLYTTGTWNVTAGDSAAAIAGGVSVGLTPASAVQVRLAGPATVTAG